MLVSVCEGPNGPPGREETQDLLKLLDVDGDGMCSREEFINAPGFPNEPGVSVKTPTVLS